MFAAALERAGAILRGRKDAQARQYEADAEQLAAGEDIDPEALADRLEAQGVDPNDLVADAMTIAEISRLEEIIGLKDERKARKEATGAARGEFIYQERPRLRREFEAGLLAKLNELTAADADAAHDLAEVERAEEELRILRRCPSFGPMSETRLQELAQANVMTGRIVQIYTNGKVEMWDEDGTLRVLSPDQVHVSPRDITSGATVRYQTARTDDGVKPFIIDVVKPEVPVLAG